MATLQVPPRLSAQTSHMYDDFDSSPSLASPSVSSSDMQEHTKKTMQTTIAIRDEKPHHFKIRPLKQVPVEKRLAMESPCMNFDRPFAGPRLELPTLYQLAPNRSASGCSFNSLKDEDPSVTYDLDSRLVYELILAQTSRPGTPPPQEQRGRGLSSASEEKLDCANYADNLSGLGLKACDSLTGSLASLRSTVGDISQEDIAETLQEYNVSQASFLHPWSAAPDLTFESSNELSLSVSPGLVTPLTSTPSSESVRKNKTKSMHVTATSAGLAFISNLPLDPPSLGRTAILERRKHTHTKAFSVSSLSSGGHINPDEGTRIHSRKRHAIYGDSEWQVDLPASDSHSSSVGSSGSSTSLPYATPAKRKSTSIARHSSAVRPVSLGNGLGIHSSAPIPTITSIPSLPSFEKSVVLPLRVSPSGMSSVKSSASIRRGSRSRDSLKAAMVWPPMVQEMLQELDEAIQEWQFACFVATF